MISLVVELTFFRLVWHPKGGKSGSQKPVNHCNQPDKGSCILLRALLATTLLPSLSTTHTHAHTHTHTHTHTTHTHTTHRHTHYTQTHTFTLHTHTHTHTHTTHRHTHTHTLSLSAFGVGWACLPDCWFCFRCMLILTGKILEITG